MMAGICLRCGASWVEEFREACANRECRNRNWDKPRREWRACPICGVSFEVDTGSRKVYHDTDCSKIAWHRRARKARGYQSRGEADAGALIRQGIEYGLKGMK